VAFLYEKDLKENFWKSYNNKGRAKKYQFECPIREGNADLITVESYQQNYQINAFEFKLDDIKKVFLQAEANIPYVNKSWIVVPIEKKQLILDRYFNLLKEKKYIGVIGVEPSGRYSIIYQPLFQIEMKSNQALTNLMMNNF
jgi:hypothetical protein